MLAPLAGIVVVSLGFTWAFWINAASYLLSAFALRRFTVPAASAVTIRTSWYADADAAAGIAAVAGHRLLRALAAGQFLAAPSAGATAPFSSSWPKSTWLCNPATTGCCSARSGP